MIHATHKGPTIGKGYHSPASLSCLGRKHSLPRNTPKSPKKTPGPIVWPANAVFEERMGGEGEHEGLTTPTLERKRRPRLRGNAHRQTGRRARGIPAQAQRHPPRLSLPLSRERLAGGATAPRPHRSDHGRCSKVMSAGSAWQSHLRSATAKAAARHRRRHACRSPGREPGREPERAGHTTRRRRQ